MSNFENDPNELEKDAASGQADSQASTEISEEGGEGGSGGGGDSSGGGGGTGEN